MVSYEREVGGSDPAIWEADVREAEELARSGGGGAGAAAARSSSQTIRAGGSAMESILDEADLEQLAMLEQMEEEEQKGVMDHHCYQGQEPLPNELEGITWDDFEDMDGGFSEDEQRSAPLQQQQQQQQGQLGHQQGDASDDVDMA